MALISVSHVETTMSMLGGKWKITIINSLITGPKRYGELKAAVTGISSKVLADQLGELIDDHLVSKQIFAEVPPHTEYQLTDMGMTLIPVMMILQKWGYEFSKKLDKGEIEGFANGKISVWGKICYQNCAECPMESQCLSFRNSVLKENPVQLID